MSRGWGGEEVGGGGRGGREWTEGTVREVRGGGGVRKRTKTI